MNQIGCCSGLALCLAVFALPVHAQQPSQSVTGVVRDTSGAPLAGAEIAVGPRSASSDPRGVFRVDSLRPGRYSVTVRLVGYSPVRSRLAVVASEPTVVEYVLFPAPYLLPAVIVDSRRTGLYGAVGDTGYRAIKGARVQVEGNRGGEVLTDSTGHFAFPEVGGGQYLVRVTFPGYTERRVMVELKRGEGRELALLLAPSPYGFSRADEIAVQALGRRLALGLERERLTSVQLERYSSMPLCDLPRIRAELPHDHNTTIALSINGTEADTTAIIDRVCAWRADEVALVEFGPDTCRDVTTTIAVLFGAWCSGRTRAVTRSMMGGGGRVSTQAGGKPYIVIWERK
jgi:Carboxypeptidase regulatory-like domain